MKKIDHIGIAVKNLEQSETIFSLLFHQQPFHKEILKDQYLEVLFYKLGDTKVELLYPTSDKSTVHKFLEKRGEGIHHVAYEVADIYKEMERLQQDGFSLLTERPYIGALNKLVCFLHPKTTNGTLVELCQQQ